MQSNPTDETASLGATPIATVIIEILREVGAGSQPVLLSSLGQRLSSHYEKPLKEVLGSQRLRNVIARSLGPMAEFEGAGSQLAVRLNEAAGSPKRPLRYDPSFWAAFSKPVDPPGARRLMSPQRPFKFYDYEDVSETPADWIEIETTRIPEAAMPKLERDAHIKREIGEWCKSHGLNTSSFLAVPLPTVMRSPPLMQESLVTIESGRTLIAMIQSIPAEQRSKFSLTLDLILQLLSN